MVLSNEQFFNANRYYDDSQLNFDQWAKHKADFYHSKVAPQVPGRHRPVWDSDHTWLDEEDNADANTLTHAGTKAAAIERAVDQEGTAHGFHLVPLRHFGQYLNPAPEPPDEDMIDTWVYHPQIASITGDHLTLRYCNDCEDKGSVSVMGPSQSFQSYTDYAGIHRKTPYQRAALEARGKHGLGDSEWVPPSREDPDIEQTRLFSREGIAYNRKRVHKGVL